MINIEESLKRGTPLEVLEKLQGKEVLKKLQKTEPIKKDIEKNNFTNIENIARLSSSYSVSISLILFCCCNVS